MNWLKKISQEIIDYSGDTEDVAMAYFGLGHGDFDPEHGELLYVLWTFRNGQVETSGVMVPESWDETEEGMTREEAEEQYSEAYGIYGPSGSHGSIWGHSITDRLYKGRYEPQIGRLSIVKPAGVQQYREIPNALWAALRQKFKELTEVRVFS